jgi:hypothetical protein
MESVITEGLTKSDIAALRLADDVYAVFTEGGYLLRCIKRVAYGERERNPFAEDVWVEVAVEGSTIVYGADSGNSFAMTESVTACFASLWDSTGIWQVVKPGDRVKLRFSANNSTDNIRAANYVRDSVSVELIRKADVNGRKPLKFHGADYVGPNNSARIVRNHMHGLS